MATKARQDKLEHMSDREKRALAAEQRIQRASGTLKKCDMCSTSITGIPFERYDFKYCSIECLLEHKKKIGK